MTANVDAANPWDKRKDETPKAYRAFKAWCALGLARSFPQLAHDLGCTPCLVKRWSHNHGWPDRVHAWDSHIGRIEQARQEKVRGEYAEKWERRRQEAAEANWGLASTLRDKVVAMLAGMTGDGKALPLTTTNLARLAKLTNMMMSLQAASVAEGRGVAEDDGFDPINASREQLEAYLARKGLKLPAPGSDQPIR